MNCAHPGCNLHAQDQTAYCRAHQSEHPRGASLGVFRVDEVPGGPAPEVLESARATKSLGGALPVRLIENAGQVPGTATITDETGRVLGHMTGIGGGEA